jgi:hypothetical protein
VTRRSAIRSTMCWRGERASRAISTATIAFDTDAMLCWSPVASYDLLAPAHLPRGHTTHHENHPPHTIKTILCCPDFACCTHKRKLLTRNPAAGRVGVGVAREVERPRVLLGGHELGDHGHQLRFRKKRRGRDGVRARHALHKAPVHRRLSTSHAHQRQRCRWHAGSGLYEESKDLCAKPYREERAVGSRGRGRRERIPRRKNRRAVRKHSSCRALAVCTRQMMCAIFGPGMRAGMGVLGTEGSLELYAP